MFRNDRHDYEHFSKRASATALARAPAAAVWDVVTSIGGVGGYYFADFLWQVRALLDRAVGGPGLSGGAPDRRALKPGDTLDSWTVVAVRPGQLLTLKFGMRTPGAAVLEFILLPDRSGRHTRITVTAYWEPQGAWGLPYWFALLPAHLFIFQGMADAIARKAEASVPRRNSPDQRVQAA